MFGEHESESPRVPSPWDSLISSPRSLSPSKSGGPSTENVSLSVSPRYLSPSPLLLPRLVPENDLGNIEYKLQLLNPSPARFTRLVTQLKWRLLEGGGQAYYELGVADSGDLVGLEREELESSLDTLEMMAGEIGASVIVVKEIEVPADLAARYDEDARNSGQYNSWGDARGKRPRKGYRGLTNGLDDSGDSTAASTVSIPTRTDMEAGYEFVATDDEYDSSLLCPTPSASNADFAGITAVFTMDSELDSEATEAAYISELEDDKLVLPSQFVIDLEISSVYKPRPMRKRFHHIHPGHHHHHAKGSKHSKAEQGKKGKEKRHTNHAQKEHHITIEGSPNFENKATTRRRARDRRREEKKQRLLALATQGVAEVANSDLKASFDEHGLESGSAAPKSVGDVEAHTEVLVEELEALHVGAVPSLRLSEPTSTTQASTLTNNTNATVTVQAGSIIADSAVHPSAEVGLDSVGNGEVGDGEVEDDDDLLISPAIPTTTSRFVNDGDGKPGVRLIVEVLVVRKMSLEEGYLDFEGFSFV